MTRCSRRWWPRTPPCCWPGNCNSSGALIPGQAKQLELQAQAGPETGPGGGGGGGASRPRLRNHGVRKMTMTSNAVSQDRDPALPEWIRVLPLGQVELSDHREPFVVDEASLEVHGGGLSLPGSGSGHRLRAPILAGGAGPGGGLDQGPGGPGRRPLGPGGLDPAGPGLPGEEGVSLLFAGTAAGPRNPQAHRP